MFNVSRFDPKADASKHRKRLDNHPGGGSHSKRKRLQNDIKVQETATTPNREENQQQRSTLHVIALEATGPYTGERKKGRIEDEAFDDLEIEHQEGATDVPLDNKDGVDGSAENLTSKSKASTGTRSEKEDATNPTPEEIQMALHMSTLPIKEAAETWKLAPFLVENLERAGFKNFFPIQALVIPDVIRSERYSNIRAQDICCAAQTGAGKTLAFVLPILNSLADRQVKRLRALVVLPSRDLALQVHDVFQCYAVGSDLKIGLAIGQSDFAAEQFHLTVDNTPRTAFGVGTDMDMAKQKWLLDSGNPRFAIDVFSGCSAGRLTSHPESQNKVPNGGRSAIDVLVCTPGRLVDHMDNTPGFTLQHLHFLVVDEADRLLSQTYHNWIHRVIESANSASISAWHEINKNPSSDELLALKESLDGLNYEIDMITWRRGGAAGDESAFSTNDTNVVDSVCRPLQLRKLLYSATLTRDPQKLAALRLVNPKHFDARSMRDSGGPMEGNHRYSMPPTLSEFSVECTAEQKPMVILALILERLQVSSSDTSSKHKSMIAVFTSSVETTHRLARLLQILWRVAELGSEDAVAEFSSSLTQTERSRLLNRCRDPGDGLVVVVCSDGMSRGLQLDYVGAVMNYDVPGFAKTYVHRCGRTARAGQEGVAISLLKGGQTVQFSKMRHLIDSPERVKPMGIKKNLVRSVIPVYRGGLLTLSKVLAAEDAGDLRPANEIPAGFFE